MEVEYIDHMGSDLRVVDAARVSFNKKSALDENGKLKRADERLIGYLAQHNHFTPFTHVIITMRETVPLFVARQRFKHIVGFNYVDDFTFNEVSRRYVYEPPEFFTPDDWRSRPEGSIKQGSGEPVENQAELDAAYAKFTNDARSLYETMLLHGVAPEQARMVLPQSMYTSYYVTGSLAAYARAYRQRIDDTAQREIAKLAERWDEILRPLFPASWSALTDY